MNQWKSTALGLALLAMTAGAGTAQETHRLDGRMVSIYNLAGTVEVVSGSGNQVVVEISRGGSDASRLSVEVDEIRGRTALRVIYPDDEISYRAEGMRGNYNSEMRVRADGTFGDGGSSRGDRVRIGTRSGGMEAHANLRISIPSGHDVRIYAGISAMQVTDVRADLNLDNHAGTIAVAGLTGNLSVDTGSGSVSAMRVTGEVEIDTGSGSVEIGDIDGPFVHVDTGSGRVTGDNVSAREVNIDTGSGSVELRRMNVPDLLVDTGSGSVEVDVISAVDRLEVDTGSGSVTLRLPRDLDAEIEVDTGSGGIDVGFEVAVQRMSRDYFRGRAGNGRGRILVDTGSGRIRLIGG